MSFIATWVCTPNEEDGFNIENKRNIRNTHKRGYNCGGYALGIFSWYLPYDNDNEQPYHYGMNYDEVMTALEIGVDTMLEDFAHRHIRLLHSVKEIDELGENEYAFAFRVSDDGDFHYVKRGRNGVWYHKMGARMEIETMSREEVFSHSWCHRYTGPIALFAIEY